MADASYVHIDPERRAALVLDSDADREELRESLALAMTEIEQLREALERIASTQSGRYEVATLEGWMEADGIMRTIARQALEYNLDKEQESAPDDLCKCGGYAAGRHNFDRSICACGRMHYYCDDCGCQGDPCGV